MKYEDVIRRENSWRDTVNIIIEKGLSALKAKEALEILIAEDDVIADYLDEAVIQKNILIKIEKDEGSEWLNDYMNSKEYVITAEYIEEIETGRIIEEEQELCETIFPYEWKNLEWYIEDNINRCEMAIKKVGRQIRDAEKYGRLPKTIKRYEKSKTQFEYDLKLLKKWQQVYKALNKKFKREEMSYGYIHKKFAMFFIHNKRKYAFVQDCPNGVDEVYELFEVRENCMVSQLYLGGEYYYY